MDYFQGVVTEYLRANRATFVNTEFMLQLDEGEVYHKGRHWYVDVVAVNHQESTVELCEISYSKSLQAMLARLAAWRTHWPGVVHALMRDSGLKGDWVVRPRVFIPSARLELLNEKLAAVPVTAGPEPRMPAPRITPLEEILPWKYRSWNGKHYE